MLTMFCDWHRHPLRSWDAIASKTRIISPFLWDVCLLWWFWLLVCWQWSVCSWLNVVVGWDDEDPMTSVTNDCGCRIPESSRISKTSQSVTFILALSTKQLIKTIKSFRRMKQIFESCLYISTLYLRRRLHIWNRDSLSLRNFVQKTSSADCWQI